MHAVVITVRIAEGKRDEAEAFLKGTVVPMVKDAPGFVSGTWLGTEDGTTGHSLAIFETKEQAEAVSKTVSPPPDAPVSVAYNQVYEVVVQA